MINVIYSMQHHMRTAHVEQTPLDLQVDPHEVHQLPALDKEMALDQQFRQQSASHYLRS